MQRKIVCEDDIGKQTNVIVNNQLANKNMKKSFIFALCALVLVIFSSCKDKNTPKSISGDQSQPAWEVPSSYDMTVSMTAIVQVDLNLSYPEQASAAGWTVAENDVLSAFCGETCLGVAELNDGLFYLYIVGPTTEEEESAAISLRYYSAGFKNTFVASEQITFRNDEHIGSISEPLTPLFIVEKYKN